jgi:hypothetical protein
MDMANLVSERQLPCLLCFVHKEGGKWEGGGPELSFPTWLALGPPMKSGGNCWLLVSLSLSAVAAAAEPDKCVLNLACACLQHM